MTDFWARCGYHLLTRTHDGRLQVTDEYLRMYFERPELALVAESCAHERALHARLLDNPRARVSDEDLAALADPDARENFSVMLRFRDQLTAAGTLEAFYFDLFRRDVAVPPPFIHHTVEVILRGILDGSHDGLEARAAELFFRPQSVTIEKGSVLVGDQETVREQVSHAGLGDVGRLLRELQAPLRRAELDVLDEQNHARYFERDERHDLVLAINPGTPGAAALARVIERWVMHFHGAGVRVEPVREIPDDAWDWHVGLDAEATAMLNDIYNGGEVDVERMKRIIGLFRMEFLDDAALQPELRGAPIFLGLAMTTDGTLRMKPQNLLMNLPLARRT
jgi:hypothetical protein